MENNSMTYQQIVNAIQVQTLNDPTPPAQGTQEYKMYTQMINNLAIPAWENERGTLWDELWVNEPAYGTIQVQTAGTPQTWSLPPDFKFIGDGFIWVTYPTGTTAQPSVRPFPIKKLPEMSLNYLQNQPEFYVYGNAINGYTLQTGWLPQTNDAEIGATIGFRYYKHANILQLDSNGVMLNSNDYPEMADPNFIIYKVSAQVSAANYNMNMYQIMEDKAAYSLLNMRMANDMASNYMDDYVKDIDALTGGRATVPNRMNSGYWTGRLGY